MVTISITKKSKGLLLRGNWSRKENAMAISYADIILMNLGKEETDINTNGMITTIIRRLCTNNERSKVTEKYLLC